ncbi:hypothetical protein UFOVP344_6 [uncultured Caudovirales phage]|uniref:Uncharacterized protein n=1 Tax=uncultured Caudovirales phage TaxID=2100421 RepID=A0A6J5LVT9_9CAUD|nr:hypothetical protein UFOVP344_6 [uncultured Caudovirales phage]
MIIRIEWLTDENECDTCGWNYAEGAKVFFDDELVLDLIPSAACYGGEHWSTEEVYNLILNKLNHEIHEEGYSY